jgi:hypothetical protein
MKMKTLRPFTFLAVAAVLALSSTLAGAEEVVRFQDGRYMKVEGHQVSGEVVKLNLANSSSMVLPLDRVDSIRSGRVVVYSAPAEDLQTVVRERRPEYLPSENRKRG